MWHVKTDSNSSTAKPVARSKKSTVGQRMFPHNFAISSNNVAYMETVFSCARQKLGRPEDGEMEQINTNAMIWGLSEDYEGNLRARKNTEFSEIMHLFSITQKIDP